MQLFVFQEGLWLFSVYDSRNQMSGIFAVCLFKIFLSRDLNRNKDCSDTYIEAHIPQLRFCIEATYGGAQFFGRAG